MTIKRDHFMVVGLYEAARDFLTVPCMVKTPLEAMDSQKMEHDDPTIISILRAGNGLLSGALEVFPNARAGFLGMYRDETALRPVDYYANLPSHLETLPALLLHPMLATGHSALAAIKHLRVNGARDIRLIALVSAPEGVKKIQNEHPSLRIYTASLDRELNKDGFILPRLGDAEDRIFNSL